MTWFEKDIVMVPYEFTSAGIPASLNIDPKGAKTNHTFPFCAVILENGELLMRSNFTEESLFVSLLS